MRKIARPEGVRLLAVVLRSPWLITAIGTRRIRCDKRIAAPGVGCGNIRGEPVTAIRHREFVLISSDIQGGYVSNEKVLQAGARGIPLNCSWK